MDSSARYIGKMVMVRKQVYIKGEVGGRCVNSLAERKRHDDTGTGYKVEVVFRSTRNCQQYLFQLLVLFTHVFTVNIKENDGV